MQAIANETNGVHYHAPDQAGLVEAFSEIAGSITVLTE
jgi:hypothetical protein